jgi:pyruvate formate lyase activating enzyme
MELCEGSGACADICPADAREVCGSETGLDDVMKAVLKERIFFEQSGGGVTLSGGEPLSQPDFAMALLEECRKNDIGTAIDTCGFVDARILLEAARMTDLFLFDVKHMDPEKHRRYTGVDNEIIKSNLAKLGESGARINARVPFIPGVNSDETNVRATGEFLSRVKGVELVSLLPYHTAAEDKHRRWGMEFRMKDSRPPTENMIASAAAVLESCGVRTAIGG